MKKLIKLSESQLHRVINEAVNSVINEISLDTVDSASNVAKERWEDYSDKYGNYDPRTKHAYNQYLTFKTEKDKRVGTSNTAGQARYLKNKNDRMNGKRTYINGKGWRTQQEDGVTESLIKRCVDSVLNEGQMDFLFKGDQKATFINSKGEKKTLTKKETDKMKKDAAKKNTKKKSSNKAANISTGDELDPNAIYPKVQNLIKSAAPLESLYTFKEHAYRSYGTIANEMLEPFLREYTEFSKKYRAIRESLAKIEEYGRKNEYETYEEARNLSYKIEDMQEALVNLCNAVNSRKKEYKMKYGNTPAYNGRASKDNPNSKRELGFVDQLFSKSQKVISNTLTNLYAAAAAIVDIADKGRNPLSYKANT